MLIRHRRTNWATEQHNTSNKINPTLAASCLTLWGSEGAYPWHWGGRPFARHKGACLGVHSSESQNTQQCTGSLERRIVGEERQEVLVVPVTAESLPPTPPSLPPG